MVDLDITDDDENTMITRADAKRMIQMAVAQAMSRISRAPLPIKLFCTSTSFAAPLLSSGTPFNRSGGIIMI